MASLTRELNLGRIERMLTLAADAPAEAVVVLSKADLVPDPAAQRRRGPRRAGRRGAGAPGLDASTAAGSTPSPRCSAPASPACCWAPPASARPRLLNALAGGERATGPIREADDRGRHTTTWRELVPLAGGGVVIDTPGLKLPRIWEQASGLASVFSDVEALARGCRFADCRHAGEPGCAVADAVGDGRLAPERLAAHEQLGREQAWASRAATRARAGVARRRRAASTASSGGSSGRSGR